MKRKRSIALYQKALEMIPGGVNSPVRAFKAIGIPPLLLIGARGQKSGTWTEMSTWTMWGPGDR